MGLAVCGDAERKPIAGWCGSSEEPFFHAGPQHASADGCWCNVIPCAHTPIDTEGTEVDERKEPNTMTEPNPTNPANNMLRYFAYQHLPEKLQAISKPLCDTAHAMASALPAGPELTAGLRKLLEAKDCFVRAALPPPNEQGGGI